MRRHDWMLRLESLVCSRLQRRFEFGAQDCSMWACDVVEAVTGRDPGADLRGTYWDKAGAEAVIQAAGGLGAIASARLGLEIPVSLAAPGDIGLVDTEAGHVLAACVGSAWLAPGAFGLTTVPAKSVLTAWRCED